MSVLSVDRTLHASVDFQQRPAWFCYLGGMWPWAHTCSPGPLMLIVYIQDAIQVSGEWGMQRWARQCWWEFLLSGLLLFIERARRWLDQTNMSDEINGLLAKRELKEAVFRQSHLQRTFWHNSIYIETWKLKVAFQGSGKGERVIAHRVSGNYFTHEASTVQSWWATCPKTPLWPLQEHTSHKGTEGADSTHWGHTAANGSTLILPPRFPKCL